MCNITKILFAIRLFKTRENLGISRAILAKETDIDQTNLANLENIKNNKMPSVRNLAKLSFALKVTTDYLLAMEPSEEELKNCSLIHACLEERGKIEKKIESIINSISPPDKEAFPHLSFSKSCSFKI